MLLPAGISGSAEWRIHNVQGQLIDQGVWQAQAGRQSLLDASSWPSGNLVVVIHHEGRNWTRWVIKE